ncbi:MAG: CubicO group peptidase (beta-lactamase class C family) [Patescibacteria group bacterium]|jgi:CubicO group peptidase (beta-lactamase class C family)
MKIITIFLLIGISVLNTACQSKPEEILTLSEGTVELDFHKNHINEILFDTKYHKPNEYTEGDIKTSLNVTNDDELFGRMFLAKTQTYYLSQLAPELPVNELCKKGSYQFTIYVDNNKLYTYNLQTGAGSCSFRNEATSIYLPLISEEDHWGKFLWLKFMKRNGGQKALSEGTHQLKIEVRPYIETTELKVGKIIAEGEVTIQFTNKEVSETEMAIQPIAPNSGWELASDQINEEKIKALNKKVAQNYFKDLTSVVVVQNGKLLLEEYFEEANRNTLHNTRSVGKSFASAITGIAIKDGHLKNEMATLKNFYKLKPYENYSPAKGEITLKDLLTMSSHFAGSDMTGKNSEDEMQDNAENWMKFALNVPMDGKESEPNIWDYWTPGTMILGDVLNKIVPDGLEVYAEKKLFAPLGIKEYKWFHTPQKVAYTGGGLEMSSLSLAKFGQLYLNDGLVDGDQIITKEWIKTSLSKQLPIPEKTDEHYGYLFWNKGYTIEGKTYDTYYATGNGGNKIFIIKELDLVVVITATAYGQPHGHIQADEMMKDFILPAVVGR